MCATAPFALSQSIPNSVQPAGQAASTPQRIGKFSSRVELAHRKRRAHFVIRCFDSGATRDVISA